MLGSYMSPTAWRLHTRTNTKNKKRSSANYELRIYHVDDPYVTTRELKCCAVNSLEHMLESVHRSARMGVLCTIDLHMYIMDSRNIARDNLHILSGFEYDTLDIHYD